MADEFDDLRSKFGVGDGFDDLRQKFGGGGAPAAAQPARLSSGEAGPQARRAATLRPPGPREHTDEELGIGGAPKVDSSLLAPQATRPIDMFPGSEAWKEIQAARAAQGLPPARTPEEAGDVAVQTGVLGMGAGALAGPVLRALGAGPAVQSIGSGAIGGGVASKTGGGDFTTGAALGALTGGISAARARSLGVPAAEPSYGAQPVNARRAIRDVTKGATKAPVRLVKEIKFKAGEEGERLTQVLGELPEARRAITVNARTNPAAAEKTLTNVIDTAVDANDAAFAAIQRQHGGVPLQPIAERLAGLEERLNLQGRGVAADAVNRVRTDLLKRYGSSPEGLAEAKLTAQQVRNIRNDMGTIADPARAITPNTRRQALGKIYDVLNKEIDDVAANTRGVNLGEFKARNRQISTLIPVRDALRHRAEAEAERSLGAKLKAIPGDVVRRGVREVGDVINTADDFAPTPAAPAAAVPIRTRAPEPPEPVRKRKEDDEEESEPLARNP